MSTINEQNARQIRDPMQIEISMQAGSSAKISNYSVPSTYKSYDNTLGNAEYSMRVLADLSGDGFPLDGTAELYDPNKTPSANNGKLGFRGNVGQDVSVTITATNNLSSVSVKASGIVSITYNGTTYPAAALNIIPIGARAATLLFACAGNNERIEIDYIVPGVALYIDNDNLVQCTLALRSNLDVENHSWEESEIEIQAYYPYDISSSFSYVQNEWPITYRAGYDGDLSTERKFYLSEPVEMKDNIITIKGVDASHRLDDKTMQEQWLDTQRGNAHQLVYQKFVDSIKSSGITIQRQQSWSGTASGTAQHAIIPEMTARDFVAGTMNLTMNHTYGSTSWAIQFVDAGIPSVEHGDGTNFGQIWTINKSDCGEWTETRERAIAKIQDTSDERKFNESLTFSTSRTTLFSSTGKTLAMIAGYAYTASRENYTATTKNQIVNLSFDGYYLTGSPTGMTTITNVPSRFMGKVKANSSIRDTGITGGTYIDALRYEITNPVGISGQAALFTGGVTSFTNPDGLPGQTIEMEPFIYGIITDSNGETVLNYPSLFKRSTHTIKFTWKGDPRMQPLDYIRLIDDTGPAARSTWFRVTNIDLTHEGGGTQAEIEAREWTAPAGA